jgi:phosphoribosylamine--glycine ligase
MKAVTEERLGELEVKFSEKHACCVIMASSGYPESYEKGYAINIPDSVAENVFVAGASIKEGVLVTSGGRVLGVTAIDESLEEAIKSSYALVNEIKFDNSYFRRDIGARALKAYEVK